MLRRTLVRTLLADLACLMAVVVVVAGCGNTERVARPRAASTNLTTPHSVPPMLRGTVMSQALLDGYVDDVVVSGYGFVVGLNGTGNRILPDQIRAHMLGEMARRGVGQVSRGSHTSPEEMLNSLDTAVVVVSAVVPPGAPKGTEFDVRVAALDGSGTTSLEGGTLWTTDLRPHSGMGLPPVGSRQARAIAEARGPIFTNPFIVSNDNNGVMRTNVVMTTGRVLSGGVTTRDIPLKLRLVSPSHARASNLQQVINSYFPQEAGQRKKTAWGEGSGSIEITIPPSWHRRTREFVHVLMHTPMFPTATDASLRYISRVLKETPNEAEHASWRWQALGPVALPAVREFYTYPEEKPRFAALRAGARLNDAMVEPYLLDLASDADNVSSTVRQDAIRLLGDLEPHPRIALGLRELLNDENVDVRITSYEALAKLGTVFVRSLVVDRQKFRIDFVDSDKPMIYVTLLDEPRIVVFGNDLEFSRPLTFSTWSGRFMMRGDRADEKIEVAYRDSTGYTARYDVSANMNEFLRFLGHTTTIERPSPGLGLSYTQVVGLLAAMRTSQTLPAEFRTEQDRIYLAILERAQAPAPLEARPEFRGEQAEEPTPLGNIPGNILESEMLKPPGSAGEPLGGR